MALKTVQYNHCVTVTQLFQNQSSQNTYFYYKNNFTFVKIHYMFRPRRLSLGEAVTKIQKMEDRNNVESGLYLTY